MATKPNMTGGASAPSNVVRLPTAAPRKVDNGRFAEQRRASRAAKQETAHRFGYRQPWAREADREAETFTETTITPALLIVGAMFKHLPPAAQDAIMESVDQHGCKGAPHRQAMLAMRMHRPMTYGEASAIVAAFDRMGAPKLRLADESEGE